MLFANVTLELESAVHVGAGRGGMLARCLGFVPGHVVTYALAAAVGKASGGEPGHFAEALETVRETLRCGPLLILDPAAGPLLPRLDRELIERRYLTAHNHVTLDTRSCSAVEGALFEVESISARAITGPARGQPTQLTGGVWFQDNILADQPLQSWFNHCLLGGEIKTGLGRVRLAGWEPNGRRYAGRWTVGKDGLIMDADDVVPGPTLEGATDAPLQPWVGRLHDPVQGFGRRFSTAALVRMDARCVASGPFLPATEETGLGCWRPA